MSPVFLKFGGFEIRYYGIMYAIAFFVGLLLVKHEAKRRNLDMKVLEDYAFTAMISGLIGGRLYYVLYNWQDYIKNPFEIIAVWHGGMAIHGGILGGIIGTIIFAKIKKLNIWTLGDIAAGPIILGQAIGRFGNFTNGELPGVPVVTPMNIIFSNNFYQWWEKYKDGGYANLKALVPWGIVFPNGTPAGDEFPGIAVHPTMFYEMFLNVIAFLIIWFILRKREKFNGKLFLIYLLMYAVIRYFVSCFRAEDLRIGEYRLPHLVSIIIFVSASMILSYKFWKEKKTGISK